MRYATFFVILLISVFVLACSTGPVSPGTAPTEVKKAPEAATALAPWQKELESLEKEAKKESRLLIFSSL
ncbi:MAG: hypothetical protein Q8Q15_02045, partial [bacterium]|nr:hypothetical protein [bacterium]